jgi:hypothetical protein
MSHCPVIKSPHLFHKNSKRGLRLGAAALVGLFGLVSTSACTTVPTENGFLSSSDTLQAARGVRGKRLQTPPPATPVTNGAKLFIEPAVYTISADVSDSVTEPERALILNALMRSLCADTSSKFEIVETATPTQSLASDVVVEGVGAPSGPTTAVSAFDIYRLRVGVSRVVATGKVGAAIGNATSFLVPVVGLRPQ